MKKVLLVALVVGFVLGSCAKLETVTIAETEVKPLAAQEMLNVSYGPHYRNKLDIYLPQGRSGNSKVIVLVHGGSWVEGDKSSMADLAKFLQNKGYACATINYRLTHTPENNIHPAQVNDLGAAIEFISGKAGEWKISPDKFGVLGASAGAHIGMLYTYHYNTDNKVKTVVSMAGPANLTDERNINPQMRTVVEWLIGAALETNPTAYEQASPINYVASASKPTLIFHGKKDVVVPPHQSTDLKVKLDQFQVKNKLVLYDETGHEVINAGNMAGFLAELDGWFRENLK